MVEFLKFQSFCHFQLPNYRKRLVIFAHYFVLAHLLARLLIQGSQPNQVKRNNFRLPPENFSSFSLNALDKIINYS